MKGNLPGPRVPADPCRLCRLCGLRAESRERVTVSATESDKSRESAPLRCRCGDCVLRPHPRAKSPGTVFGFVARGGGVQTKIPKTLNGGLTGHGISLRCHTYMSPRPQLSGPRRPIRHGAGPHISPYHIPPYPPVSPRIRRISRRIRRIPRKNRPEPRIPASSRRTVRRTGQARATAQGGQRRRCDCLEH